MTDTAIATQKQEHPLVVLRSKLEARSNEIKAAWPGVAPDRIIRAIITSAQINPDLLATNFTSLFLACMRACRDGLIPDGTEGSIVAFKDRATWIPGYRGLLKKFQQSGQFKHVVANCVYEGDEFAHYIDEHGEHLRHTPSDTFDDAKIVRVYAMASTLTGGVFIAVMSRKEIDKIRKMSRATREDSPWSAHFSEMAKKTALRRLSKMLPAAPLFEDDDDVPDTEAPTAAPVASIARAPGAAAALEQFSRASPAGDNPHPVSDDDAREEDGEQGVADPQSVASVDHDPAAVDEHTEQLSIVSAFKAGQAAKAAGHARKALPGLFRDPSRSKEATAWVAGWSGESMPEFFTEGER